MMNQLFQEHSDENRVKEPNKLADYIRDFASRIADLQEIFINLSTDNFTQSIKEIESYCFFDNDDQIHDFLFHLIEATEYRPLKIDIFCDFLIEIFRQKKSLIGFVRKDLLKQLFRSFLYQSPFPEQSSKVHFLYRCYFKGILELGSIIKLIQKTIDNYIWYSESIAWIVSYFIDLVPEGILNEARSRTIKNPPINPIFKKFLNSYRFNDYYENNERKNSSIFIKILKKDDVDALNMSLCPNYNYDLIIEPDIFEECRIIQYRPTLISCAAFFGSIKCFKYLLLNHASLSRRDERKKSIATFAVSGGNVEIIRILEQEKIDFDDTIKDSVIFYHFDIFEWIRVTKFTEDLDSYNITQMCAYSGNIKILIHCINSGCNVNRFFLGQTPILKAAEKGKSDVIKILLSLPEINPNEKCESETPLIYAARNGNVDCVKILCSSPKVKLNEVGIIGSALHYATFYCHAKVVKILLQTKRIDTSIRDHLRETALQTAKNNNIKKIEKILTEDQSFFGYVVEHFKDFINGVLFWLL